MIHPANPTLDQRPETFDGVGVNVPAYIDTLGMMYSLMLEPVLCKFVCNSATKRKNWNVGGNPFLWDYSFAAVTIGSKENEEFFAYTPSAELKVVAVKKDLFEPGQEYFLEIKLAIPEPKP